MQTRVEISQREADGLVRREYPDVMDIEQMCRVLHVSTKTGYRILQEGKIRSLKVGRSYRIPKTHLLSYLCQGVQVPAHTG